MGNSKPHADKHKKTRVMTIIFTKSHQTAPNMKLNGDEPTETRSMKLLGMPLQRDLNWKTCIDCVISRCNNRL